MPGFSEMPLDARITDARQVLVVLSPVDHKKAIGDFCGAVVTDLSALPDLAGKVVYLCGDLSKVSSIDLSGARHVRAIRGLCGGEDVEGEGDPRWPLVDLGRVPVRVHGAGVLYRRFFDPAGGHFRRIKGEHEFQSLTESTKPGKAHRTGIYLTPVRREGDALHFHLLRCSTNLSGPTENFRATDREIVGALNDEVSTVFDDAAPLNHVLAQIYHNTAADDGHKETKARISPHADKTKDMPGNGLIAFCTFYDDIEGLSPLRDDPFDLGHARASGLTSLRFKLKEGSPPGDPLPAEFVVKLYPGSVFLIPLSTNRLYTHEIVPSGLSAARIPTRLGYVVRCSSTEAVHRDGQTFLDLGGELVPLEEPTHDGMTELRWLYTKENRSKARIHYGGRFRFSMNRGDYRAPDEKE